MKRFVAIAVSLAPLLVATNSAGAQEQIRLEAMTDQGTFLIEMMWTPNEIGRDNSFLIRFVEPETGAEMEDMKYNLLVLQGENSVQKLRRVDQIATQQVFRFDEPGPYTIKIEDIDGLGEGAAFSINVTPEFPAGAILFVAAAIGVAALAGRRYSYDLFRF
ncbi:MAG: hypothetical protein ACREBU_02875 [Nitrososphaera sp.]